MAQSDNGDMYILALEYASKRLKDGVTYTEILTYLTDNYMPLEKQLLHSFQWWFFSNFYHPEVFHLVRNNKEKFTDLDLSQYYHEKMTLTVEAYEFLVRYKEINTIKQLALYSNRSALKAQKTALYSIWITAGLAVVLLLIAVLGIITG